MRIAYFDCFAGAAGDMIVAAGLDAGASAQRLREELGKLRLPEKPELRIEKIHKHGFHATRFRPFWVDQKAPAEPPKNAPDHAHKHEHGHEHDHVHDHSQVKGREHPQAYAAGVAPETGVALHRNLSMIRDIILSSDLSERVKEQACGIFQRLARAEARVHGTTEEQVHFHEVGATDSIMDIVGACIVLEELKIEKVYASPLVVGGGTIPSAHGILPVPAPATAELIRGIEIVPSAAQLELLTPTGAAILVTLAERFGPLPAMKIDAIGYGAGSYDQPHTANVLRLLVGDSALPIGPGADQDEVVVLEANIDDTSGEVIGHVTEKLLQAGALDVYCTAISMKKNRPATQISAICHPEKIGELEATLFRESTTFGIRRHLCQRSILDRRHETVETPYGPIRIKIGSFGGQEVTASPEFADCQRAAEQFKIPVKMVIQAALTAYSRG